jgi:hypothetical protein
MKVPQFICSIQYYFILTFQDIPHQAIADMVANLTQDGLNNTLKLGFDNFIAIPSAFRNHFLDYGNMEQILLEKISSSRAVIKRDGISPTFRVFISSLVYPFVVVVLFVNHSTRGRMCMYLVKREQEKVHS